MDKKCSLLVFTGSYEMGGAEKYIIDLLPFFLKKFHAISLLCKDYPAITSLRDVYGNSGCAIINFKQSTYRLGFMLKIPLSVIKHDIVFVNKNSPKSGLFIIFISRLLGKKIVAIEHLDLKIKSKYFFKPPIMRMIIWFCMKLVNVTICTNDVSKHFFLTYYKYDPSKVVVIPLGITLRNNFEGRFFSAERKKTIILVGRLSEQKNHIVFLDIIYKIVQEHLLDNFCVEFWGAGELKEDIKRKITEFKLSQYVFLMGHVDDKDQVYNGKDVVVIPSINEGQSYVLLEAASYKIPTISFNVGGISSFIEDGVNGRLISPGDNYRFCRVLIELMQNPRLRHDLGERAYEKAVHIHDANIVYQKVVDRMVTL